MIQLHITKSAAYIGSTGVGKFCRNTAQIRRENSSNIITMASLKLQVTMQKNAITMIDYKANVDRTRTVMSVLTGPTFQIQATTNQIREAIKINT